MQYEACIRESQNLPFPHKRHFKHGYSRLCSNSLKSALLLSLPLLPVSDSLLQGMIRVLASGLSHRHIFVPSSPPTFLLPSIWVIILFTFVFCPQEILVFPPPGLFLRAHYFCKLETGAFLIFSTTISQNRVVYCLPLNIHTHIPMYLHKCIKKPETQLWSCWRVEAIYSVGF